MHYGLALARTVPLQPSVVERGLQVAVALEVKEAKNAGISSATLKERQRKLIHDLAEELEHAQSGALEGPLLAQWLILLRKEFVERMSDLHKQQQELRQP